MSEVFQIIKGPVKAPWAVLIYGNPGLGKSTWASKAPKPLFLDLEDGLARIDCHRTPVITTYEALRGALQHASKSDYETIVFDTADAMEKLMTSYVCEQHGKASLADFGYGKGEVALRAEWARMINAILWLKAKGKNVILTAHELIQKFDDPTSESYDRFTLNLEKKAAPAVTAALDAVLFARWETVLREREGTGKQRAVGTGKRVVHTVESPSWVAKNRMRLPEVCPLTPALFAKFGGEERSEETK